MARARSGYGEDARELEGASVRESVTLEERQLLVRHRRGEEGAFAELVALYRAPVFSYLVRWGVEPDARDDLFQDIFLRIHKAAWSYRPDRPLRPWLFTIAANTVRSHQRRKRVRQLVFLARVLPEQTSSEPNGQQLLEARETASWIDQALRRLSTVQREVVILCCIERLSQQEVGAILGLAAPTLRTHLRRGRLALARALAQRHAGEEEGR